MKKVTRIRELREAQGLTQEELAAKCNVLKWGISRGTLAKIEAKVRRIRDQKLHYWLKCRGWK
jgi:transcriptional regulator with XRE-family HTH domain